MDLNKPKTLRLKMEHMCSHQVVSCLNEGALAIKHQLSLHNHTEDDFEARDRLGFTQQIQCDKNRNGVFYRTAKRQGLNKLYVKLDVEMDYKDLDIAIAYYDQLRHESPIYEKLYQDAVWSQKEYAKSRGVVTISASVQLSRRDFMVDAAGGYINDTQPLYIEEFGITLGVAGHNTLTVPDCVEDVIKARNNATTLAFKDALNTCTIVSVEAVDNSGHREYDKLYVSICDKTYDVPVRYDSNSATHGVIVRSHPSVEELRANPMLKPDDVITQVLTFEEAFEKMNVATSIDGARSRGDSKRSLELELAARTTEVKRMDMELAEMTRRNKIAEEERKVAIQERDDERQELERIRKSKESELTHTRTLEKMTMDHEMSTNKHQREMAMVKERGFWDSVGSLFKVFSTVISLGRGMNKLLMS